LFALYSLEHRRYHNMMHVEECLEELDWSLYQCTDPIACEMAVWYHDVVYEPTSDQNERLSANKALFDCLRLGVTDEVFKDAVVRLILGTKHSSEAKGDAATVADIDLSILGKPWERFSEYERQIREEYSHVPDRDFAAGRTAILDGFLRRPSIYWTTHFRERYEKPARANIALSIRKLGAAHA